MKCNYTFVLSNCVGQKTTGRVNVYVQNVNDNWPVCQNSVLTASVSELAGTAHGFYLPCTIFVGFCFYTADFASSIYDCLLIDIGTVNKINKKIKIKIIQNNLF